MVGHIDWEDPAMKRFAGMLFDLLIFLTDVVMRANQHQYFRWTPRSVAFGISTFILVPGLLYYFAEQTTGMIVPQGKIWSDKVYYYKEKQEHEAHMAAAKR